MKRYVYDVECMKDFFSVTFIDWDSNDCLQFEISDRKNQLNEIKKTLLDTSYLIGFNILHYDNPILGWINQQKQITAEEIFKVSQITINQDNDYDAFKPYYKYKEWKTIKSIDLFMFWSKMLRISKKLSLKFFAVSLDEEVLEMPIHYTKGNLTDEEKDLILFYNENDVKITKKLGLKLREEINLRLWIQKEYGLECLSKDAPGIASEILLDSYCKKTYIDEIAQHTIYNDYKKEIRKQRIEFFKFKNGDYIPEIKFKTKLFQDLYEEICKSYNGFSKEIIFTNYDNTKIKISYGSGGVHTINNNEYYLETDSEFVITSDVQSLYPQLLINYGFVGKHLGTDFLDIYSNIKKERVAAKKQKLKTKDTFLKLCLNSVSGLLDNSYSWMYSPAEIMGLRLTGQLLLSRLTEECFLNKFKVISKNTDGIETIIPKNRLEEYYNIVKIVENEFNVIFEHDFYKAIYYSNVNNYISITNSGKIKCKGEFVYEKVLDGSNDMLIIPIAIKEYLVNNISIEQTIKNHKNIYDFCSAKKIARDYTIFYKNEIQQQLNRFFVSKKGAYLYKQKKGKTTYEHVFKDGGVILLNQKTDKTPQELNVDFQYYIIKANQVLQVFQKSQLSLF